MRLVVAFLFISQMHSFGRSGTAVGYGQLVVGAGCSK